MPKEDENRKTDFLVEEIKKRPVNKKKLLRRTIITASLAVVFGLIATITFLVLEPVINNWLYRNDNAPTPTLKEAEESKEQDLSLYISPSTSPEIEKTEVELEQEVPGIILAYDNEEGTVTLSKEQMRTIAGEFVFKKENYSQMYLALSAYANDLKKYLVTVTGISSRIDVFENRNESFVKGTGVNISNDEENIYILVDFEPFRGVERITLTFNDGTKVNAESIVEDDKTKLAIIAVKKSLFSEKTLIDVSDSVMIGTASAGNMIGTPVIAIGSPMGEIGSMGYGIISSSRMESICADTNYLLLQTSIEGSKSGRGFVFNMYGHLLGVITNEYSCSDVDGMLTAYGVAEIKRRITRMISGEKINYLGIIGHEVSKEASEEWGIPLGAFVEDVEKDSPAMLIGILPGDIVVSVDNHKIRDFIDYSYYLMCVKEDVTYEITVMRQVADSYKEIGFTVTN